MNWIVEMGDAKARISIDHEGDLTVFIEHDDGSHLAALALTPLHGCQFGVALVDASRVAGALQRKLEDKAERVAARLIKTVNAATKRKKRKKKR